MDSHIPKLSVIPAISQRYSQNFEINKKISVYIRVENFGNSAHFKPSQGSSLIKNLKLSKFG